MYIYIYVYIRLDPFRAQGLPTAEPRLLILVAGGDLVTTLVPWCASWLGCGWRLGIISQKTNLLEFFDRLEQELTETV